MSTFRDRQGKTVITMDILPPEHQPNRAGRTRQPRREAVDAEFVTLRERPRGGRTQDFHNDNRWDNRWDNRRDNSQANRRPSPPVRKTGPAAEGAMGRLMARIEASLMRLSADMFSAVVAMIFVAVFSLAGGFSFLFNDAAEVPASGPALDITHVSLTPQDQDGMRVLLINGIVENRGAAGLQLPSIRADLMTGESVLTTTLIKAPVQTIEGGRSHGFSARIPHPGGKLPDLRLSFVEQGASNS